MTEDARTARTRAVVLDATADLLLNVGCERLTIDEIAAKSGVARSTIYRNWGDKSALVVDAVDCIAGMPPPPDTGTLAGDLTVVADRLAHNLSDGMLGKLLPSLVSAASCDDELMARLQGMSHARFELTRTIFERAIVRGEIGNADVQGRAERFIAPFFARHLLHGWPLDQTFQERQIAAATTP
ncbi:MAG: AcrR family transcriptional regulator [Verrucomicrobiales bacterium]|jgi:AcrR family transcriptional regulator